MCLRRPDSGCRCPRVHGTVGLITIRSGEVVVTRARPVCEKEEYSIADYTCGIRICRVHHRRREKTPTIVSRRQISPDCVVGGVDVLPHSLVQDLRLTLLGPMVRMGNVSAYGEFLNLNEIENLLCNDGVGIAAPKTTITSSPI